MSRDTRKVIVISVGLLPVIQGYCHFGRFITRDTRLLSFR